MLGYRPIIFVAETPKILWEMHPTCTHRPKKESH